MKACAQEQYCHLLDGVTNKEESTWLNDAKGGEAGKPAFQATY
jgi:hypothetical protein